MKNKKVLFSKSRLIVSVAIGLAVASFLGIMVPFSQKCENIRENVFRLHILANSDSEEDQALKLVVRDGILDLAEEMFKDSVDKAEAIESAKENTLKIKQEAERVLAEKGYDQKVEISVGKAWFNTREYDDFTLPAGEYDALKVVIGEGEGKNWWCVMFPAVCIPAATAEIDDALDKEESEIVHNKTVYKPCFKIVEIFESIKRFFKR